MVGELLIVQALSGSFVVDLDNWAADESRNLVGFVIDVLGKIETPYYAIKPEVMPCPNWVGKSVFYIEGSSKILKDEDIKSMQSKSAAEVEDMGENSSEEELEQPPRRKFSEERAVRPEKRERRRSPVARRNNRFEDELREGSRERTR